MQLRVVATLIFGFAALFVAAAPTPWAPPLSEVREVLSLTPNLAAVACIPVFERPCVSLLPACDIPDAGVQRMFDTSPQVARHTYLT
ncbi:hypothetical protein FB451DRAFT_1418214 [Mycena latifolia]|nr:hypothetical protein FB451DRAFT_1418214 [Mycena latifolia]